MRTLIVAGAVVLGGLTALGCSSSTATPPSTTPTTSVAATTPLGWLVSEAKPANKRLNQDQATVLVASRSTSETAVGPFFAHLATACSAMLGDARRSENLPSAPSASLDSAWRAMARATATYASDCLTLTRTHANASLTSWNDSLRSMNAANGALNTVVAAIRSGATPTGE